MKDLMRFKMHVKHNDLVLINTITGIDYCGFFKELNEEEIIINPVSYDESKMFDINIEIEEIRTYKKLR